MKESLQSQTEHALRIIRSSLTPEGIIDDGAIVFLGRQILTYEEYTAFTQETPAPTVTITRDEYHAAAHANMDDIMCRLAQTVTWLLTNQDTDATTEERANAVVNVLQQLTGGRKPRT